MGDKLKTKLTILFFSAVAVAICVLLYFSDDSLEWGTPKIFSCAFINLWLFFLAPAFRYFYLDNRNKSSEEWFKMGFSYGASGISVTLLAAPYFGIKYYFCGNSHYQN